jgi:hypothetical protein
VRNSAPFEAPEKQEKLRQQLGRIMKMPKKKRRRFFRNAAVWRKLSAAQRATGCASSTAVASADLTRPAMGRCDQG